MKVLRAFGLGVAVVVLSALSLSTCGLQAGTPTIRSSGDLKRDAVRVVNQCAAFDGFLGIWIEGPSGVRVNFPSGRHTLVPCPPP